jgi:hypothetical protein
MQYLAHSTGYSRFALSTGWMGQGSVSSNQTAATGLTDRRWMDSGRWSRTLD